MAAFPCMRCSSRFPGEARNVYLTLYEGSQRAAFRYVLCPTCRELLVREWIDQALYRGPDGDWEMAAGDGSRDIPWTASDEGEGPIRRFRVSR